MAEETPKKYLLGNDAIAHACLEAGVDFVSGYPGTPSSEVVDRLRAGKDPWSIRRMVS